MQAPICEGAFRIERRSNSAIIATLKQPLPEIAWCRQATRVASRWSGRSQATQRQVARLAGAHSKSGTRPRPIARRGGVSGQQIKSGLQALDAVDEQDERQRRRPSERRRAAAPRPASSPPASRKTRRGGALIFRRSVARCVAAHDLGDVPLRRRATRLRGGPAIDAPRGLRQS